MKKTLAFFEIEPWEQDYLKKQLTNFNLHFIPQKLNEQTLTHAQHADAIGIFIHSHLDNNLLSKLKKTKLITTLSTGYDHIDLHTAQQQHITICNVPEYGTNTVAEHAFALLLALARKIVPSIEKTRRGNFDLTGLRGTDIQGKTLGIIGTGKIGTHTIHIAKGFQLNVIAYDSHPDKKSAKKLGFTYVKKLDDLLKQADFISLHVPLLPSTTHLINTKNVTHIKKGCILINTARGGVVQTSALILGLKKGIFSGIGLDVLEEECFVKEEKELLTKTFQKTCDYKTILEEHLLLQYDNVLITPHNAFNSQEAVQRILETTVKNIQHYFKGKPINVVK